MVVCDYCGQKADLVTGLEIYPHRYDLHHKHFYKCRPCEAWVGCHQKTKRPLGRLANAELRKWKMLAHQHFDPHWNYKSNVPKYIRRGKAYKELAERLGIPKEECHIGMFDVETCRKVVKICQSKLRK